MVVNLVGGVLCCEGSCKREESSLLELSSAAEARGISAEQGAPFFCVGFLSSVCYTPYFYIRVGVRVGVRVSVCERACECVCECARTLI